MSLDEKQSNPKQAFADTKLPLDVVPSTLIAYAALGFLEGALKYGTANWREKGVSARTYVGAAMRHLLKWVEGEEWDPVTKVPHLASVLACVGIILDARECGKLNDDRPKSVPEFSHLVDQELAEVANHLRQLFKDKKPRHYTIADNDVA